MKRDLYGRLQSVLAHTAGAPYQLSAAVQARQHGFGIQPRGFGRVNGHEDRGRGTTRAVERVQGPTEAVRATRQAEKEIER